jgi:translocation and assembly module TamA
MWRIGAFLVVLTGCAGERANGRPWIHALRLEGVDKASESDLRERIALTATSRAPLAQKRYLDPFAIDADRPRIEAFYRARGYFDAHVVGSEIIRRDAESVDVVLHVEEGVPTRVAEIRVRGAEAPPGGLTVGDPFDHARYLAWKDELAARLRSRGFAWPKVSGRVEIDRAAHRANILVDVDPGPQATFGTVAVQGAVAVDPGRIARTADIPGGKRFDGKVLDEARRRIHGLGVFSSVRVEAHPAPDRPDRADITIDVRESSFRELRLGGGFGLEPQRNDVHLTAIHTRRNFLGGLRTLRLKLAPAWVAMPALWDVQRQGPAVAAEAQLTQPDVPWSGAQLRWTVGYDLGFEYAYQYHGPRTQVGISVAPLGGRLQLGVSYNLQFLDFFNTDPTILADPVQAGRLYGYVDPFRVGWWQQDVYIDLRDDPFAPRSGLYAGVTVEEGGAYAGGAFDYQKLVPEGRLYAPLGRLTLALRGQLGQIYAQGTLASPITRRLYLGGAGSHRGFAYNRLSPQVPSGQQGVLALPVGGDQSLLLQAELRLSILKLAGSWLQLAAFSDAGDVAGAKNGATAAYGACPDGLAARVQDSVALDRLHVAVGAGLHYQSIIGTIRADLGVRLNRLAPCEPDGTQNPDPGERIAFHISVGEAF